MRKWFFLISIMFWPVLAGAAQVYLVYKNEEAVKNHEYWLGVPHRGDVLIQASQAVEAQFKPIIGDVDGVLLTSTVSKFDLDAGIAIVTLGEKIRDSKLIRLHEATLGQIKEYLAGELPVEEAASVLDDPLADDLIYFYINGLRVGRDPIKLKTKYKKSQIKFEWVYNGMSSKKQWKLSLDLESSPQLGFMRKGSKQGLNDIPKPSLVSHYQSMFNSLKKGKKVKMTVDIHYVKEKTYEWKIKAKLKDEVFEKTFQVEFEEE